MQGLLPLAFAQVDSKIYRSSYPAKKSLPFIESLHLKSLVCLSPNELKQELRDFCELHNIELIEKNVGYNQEPFIFMHSEVVEEVLSFISNPSNQPVMVFCVNGKLRSNSVIGCYRKLIQKWSLISIFHELEQFGGSEIDYLFIEKI